MTALIYLLFFAYFPPFKTGDSNTVEISEETIIRECPEIAITDYDREFLDRILNDPRFEEIENRDEYASIIITADEAEFERYALRPDENYTVHADNMGFGRQPSVSIQFEYEGGIYGKDLFLSAEKSDTQIRYVKAVTIMRSDGKLIRQYWNFNGRYEKNTWTYGLVGYIKDIMNAIYGC